MSSACGPVPVGSKHVYSAFGLRICSEIEFGDFTAGEAGSPDVNIRLGDVPESLDDPSSRGILYECTPQQFLLNVPGTARYLVSDGNDILVQPAVGSDPRAVGLFLFGPAFGAVLHQRNVLTLHASGIVSSRGAVLFAGLSGCGKSTIAASLHQRGYSVLADDLCPIQITPTIEAMPGCPFLMLWKDVLKEAIPRHIDLCRVRPELEKYVLPLGTGFARKSALVHTVYIVETTNAGLEAPTPIKGVGKIEALTRHTYRPRFVVQMGRENSHMSQVVAVARSARIMRIGRPRGRFQLDELIDSIEADLKV